jgi:TatD DNase family protein
MGAAASPRLWDTHCHLADPGFAADRADVLRRAREAGVGDVVVVGTAPEEWEAAARVVRDAPEEGPRLHLVLGLHPHHAARGDRDLWRRLEEALLAHRAVALGEIGLDYHYPEPPAAEQRRAFAAQLELAARLGLPVVLHEREAAEEALAVLGPAGAAPGGLVWHCFSHGPDVAERAVAAGAYLGFGGLITFPRGTEAIRAAARGCPSDRLVLETDAPYLSPVPFRGRRNEPARVAVVLAFLATLRAEEPAALAAATSRNAARLFLRPGTGS